MPRLIPGRAAEIRRILEAGDLPQTIRIHRGLFPSQGSTVIHDTDVDDLLECLYTPLPVFSFCADAELRELRLRMAVAIVQGGRCVLKPDDKLPWNHVMTPEAAVQNFFASTANYRNVSAWIKSGVVLRARICCSCDGPCPACAAARSQDYDLPDLPSIPIRACANINTMGCRCIAVASKIKGIDW